MRILWTAVMFCWVTTAWCAPQLEGNLSPARVPSVAIAPVTPVSVATGKSAGVRIDFRVASGFHVNSNQPKSDLLVPTTLKLSPPTDIMIGKVTYPAGQDLTFPFMPAEKLNVYTGDFRVTALVKPVRTVRPGTYRVHGTLKYQACDNRQCYPPKEVPLAFDVKVRKGSTASTRHNPGQSPHVHR